MQQPGNNNTGSKQIGDLAEFKDDPEKEERSLEKAGIPNAEIARYKELNGEQRFVMWLLKKDKSAFTAMLKHYGSQNGKDGGRRRSRRTKRAKRNRKSRKSRRRS